MKTKNIFPTSLIFSLIIIIGCSKTEVSETTPPIVVSVKSTIIKTGKIEETISAIGSTFVQKTIKINSPLTGIITNLKFVNGDRVKKGDIICILRTKESQAEIYGREEILKNNPSGVKTELEHSLKSEIHTPNEIKLFAPFAGVLLNKVKYEGEIISEGEQIATLNDDNSIVFVANVPVVLIPKIKIGQRSNIRFTAFPNKILNGNIKRIEPQINSANQTIPVQIEFNHTGKEFANSLFGEVSIIIGIHSNALLVPVKAILHDDEKNIASIFTIDRDSIAHNIEVDVLLKNDSIAEIASPQISVGMNIIEEGHYGLPDSTKIQVVK